MADNCDYTGNIVGAVIGTFIATLVLVAIVYFLWDRYRRKQLKDSGLANLVIVEDGKDTKNYSYDNAGFNLDDIDGKKGHQATSDNDGGVKMNGKGKPVANDGSKKLPWGRLKFLFKSRNALDDSVLEEPQVYNVSLKGHDFTGLGFSICGNMRDGIFVKDIMQRGPAAESKSIIPGDQIVGMTVSFKNMALEDAITLLSYASPYEVTLNMLRLNEKSLPHKGIMLSSPSHPSAGSTSSSTNNTNTLERVCHPFFKSISIDDLRQVGKKHLDLKVSPNRKSQVNGVNSKSSSDSPNAMLLNENQNRSSSSSKNAVVTVNLPSINMSNKTAPQAMKSTDEVDANVVQVSSVKPEIVPRVKTKSANAKAAAVASGKEMIVEAISPVVKMAYEKEKQEKEQAKKGMAVLNIEPVEMQVNTPSVKIESTSIEIPGMKKPHVEIDMPAVVVDADKKKDKDAEKEAKKAEKKEKAKKEKEAKMKEKAEKESKDKEKAEKAEKESKEKDAAEDNKEKSPSKFSKFGIRVLPDISLNFGKGKTEDAKEKTDSNESMPKTKETKEKEQKEKPSKSKSKDKGDDMKMTLPSVETNIEMKTPSATITVNGENQESGEGSESPAKESSRPSSAEDKTNTSNKKHFHMPSLGNLKLPKFGGSKQTYSFENSGEKEGKHRDEDGMIIPTSTMTLEVSGNTPEFKTMKTDISEEVSEKLNAPEVTMKKSTEQLFMATSSSDMEMKEVAMPSAELTVTKDKEDKEIDTKPGLVSKGLKGLRDLKEKVTHKLSHDSSQPQASVSISIDGSTEENVPNVEATTTTTSVTDESTTVADDKEKSSTVKDKLKMFKKDKEPRDKSVDAKLKEKEKAEKEERAKEKAKEKEEAKREKEEIAKREKEEADRKKEEVKKEKEEARKEKEEAKKLKAEEAKKEKEKEAATVKKESGTRISLKDLRELTAFRKEASKEKESSDSSSSDESDSEIKPTKDKKPSKSKLKLLSSKNKDKDNKNKKDDKKKSSEKLSSKSPEPLEEEAIQSVDDMSQSANLNTQQQQLSGHEAKLIPVKPPVAPMKSNSSTKEMDTKVSKNKMKSGGGGCSSSSSSESEDETTTTKDEEKPTKPKRSAKRKAPTPPNSMGPIPIVDKAIITTSAEVSTPPKEILLEASNATVTVILEPDVQQAIVKTPESGRRSASVGDLSSLPKKAEADKLLERAVSMDMKDSEQGAMSTNAGMIAISAPLEDLSATSDSNTVIVSHSKPQPTSLDSLSSSSSSETLKSSPTSVVHVFPKDSTTHLTVVTHTDTTPSTTTQINITSSPPETTTTTTVTNTNGPSHLEKMMNETISMMNNIMQNIEVRAGGSVNSESALNVVQVTPDSEFSPEVTISTTGSSVLDRKEVERVAQDTVDEIMSHVKLNGPTSTESSHKSEKEIVHGIKVNGEQTETKVKDENVMVVETQKNITVMSIKNGNDDDSANKSESHDDEVRHDAPLTQSDVDRAIAKAQLLLRADSKTRLMQTVADAHEIKVNPISPSGRRESASMSSASSTSSVDSTPDIHDDEKPLFKENEDTKSDNNKNQGGQTIEITSTELDNIMMSHAEFLAKQAQAQNTTTSVIIEPPASFDNWTYVDTTVKTPSSPEPSTSSGNDEDEEIPYNRNGSLSPTTFTTETTFQTSEMKVTSSSPPTYHIQTTPKVYSTTMTLPQKTITQIVLGQDTNTEGSLEIQGVESSNGNGVIVSKITLDTTEADTNTTTSTTSPQDITTTTSDTAENKDSTLPNLKALH